MITCKQVSKALAENKFHELPMRKRIALLLHIKLCAVCGKANRQIVTMQSGIKKMLDNEGDDVYIDIKLSSEAKKNLKEKISLEND